MEIKIGADPEVFLFDTKLNKYQSAAGFFPGTKKEPFKVANGAIQVDGVALEFNIDPASSEEEFVSNIKSVHKTLENMVHDVNPNWEIRHIPYVEFNEKDWEAVPTDAKQLGCDPDFNYTGNVNPNPADNIEYYARYNHLVPRTGSGHIHIGWSENENPESAFHFEDCRACAEYFWRNSHQKKFSSDLDYKRFNYYGNLGSFRSKPYGVELRSPSNSWLKSERSIREIYRETKRVFDKFASGA